MKKLFSVILCAIVSLNIVSAAVPLVFAAGRNMEAVEAIASDLKELGLFKGVSDTDFDLDRAPSRTEAIVMLIRILGKENDALNGRYSHPFTDVDAWADKYVGYAYSTGLTNGISATEFGASDANAATFLTFVLRALGYSDANGLDFTWDDPFALARDIGILTDEVNIDNFLRADVAIIAYNALEVNIKGTTTTLAQKLIADGVFTAAQYSSIHGTQSTPADDTPAAETPVTPAELSAKQIFENCSPSVFSIATYDITGAQYAIGSGFFIDSDGTAVTNAHVLVNAITATATLPDGTECEIEGVMKIDGKNDFAIIKVKGEGFTALELGDAASLVTGEKIYAIGNPQGLSNTISDGIVSNPGRAEYYGWIQITAPISPGSSGGALINDQGKVIGVTTATLSGESQNLNFAVPISTVIESEDLLESLEAPDIMTMRDYTVLMDFFSYFDALTEYNFIPEAEPYNNSIDTAGYIGNGDAVLGYIDFGASGVDISLVRCNAPGMLMAFAVSPMAMQANTLGEKEYKELTEDVTKQIDLMFEKVDDSSIRIKAVTSQLDNGTMAMIIQDFEVPEAGIYALKVSSDSLYDDDLDLTALGSLAASAMYDYVVYYVYLPDYTKLPVSQAAIEAYALERFAEIQEYAKANGN